jgi:tetratricopeptide (TPR) repeat protein
MELLHIWSGHLHAESGDMAVALASYRRCKSSGFVLNEIGCILLKQDQALEASVVLEKAVSLSENENTSAYRINYATALRRAGKFEQAVRVLKDVEQKEPENVHAILGLGFTLHLMFRIEEAIERYVRVLALSPDNSFAMAMLDEALPVMGRYAIPECGNEKDGEFAEKMARWMEDNGCITSPDGCKS